MRGTWTDRAPAETSPKLSNFDLKYSIISEPILVFGYLLSLHTNDTLNGIL